MTERLAALLVALLVAGPVLFTMLRWAVWPWLAASASALGVVAGATLAEGLWFPLSLGLTGAIALLFQDWPAPVVARWHAALVLAVSAFAQAYLAGWPDGSGPGAVLIVLAACCLVAGGAGAVGAGRAAGTPIRWVCLATTAVSAAGIAIVGDLLAAWVLLPAAGALGLTALARGRRGAAYALPQADEVDEQVVAAFDRDHPGLVLPPVVVVIAAYNEAAGVPGVLAALPRELHGYEVEALVVDDGSTDETARSARAAVAAAGWGHVVSCPVNRGQGRALRLGYRLARTAGARFIVTTDADGQYSTAEIRDVLAPVVQGRADFVTGSRRRGRLENRDAVRQAGTYVFAWLASLLLGRWITDTSFGLRAMRAEVTAGVTLNQPQYQASELLVGVFSRGFRYAEVPATMRVRTAGSSKKGGNLVYGARYARVMIGTWWREGCPQPVAECAPALRRLPRHVPVDASA